MMVPRLVGEHNTKEFRSVWHERYAEKHRLRRVTDLPAGIKSPGKVRIYNRSDYYVLQWWDRHVKKTLSLRVDGDLIEAITKARELESRMLTKGPTVAYSVRLGHGQLVSEFAANLEKRADLGEISPATVRRYQSALAHYLAFASQPHIQAKYDRVCQADRQFALEFRSYLKNLWVSPNGHAAAEKKRLQSIPFVMSVARSLYAWAADEQAGNLLSAGFRNPFSGRLRDTAETSQDMLCDPDITLEMAAEFIRACDSWQLPLFCLYIFYGLRAAEPCWLFAESLSDEWIKIECDKSLGYVTKGRRDKRLPLIDPVRRALSLISHNRQGGLLFRRRDLLKNQPTIANYADSRDEFRSQFLQQLRDQKITSSALIETLRCQLHREAGGLNYHFVEREFKTIHARLGWPKSATLKDFRHLFSTCIGNAGIPEHYRQYLLGQSQGKAAITNYTHLNKLKEHFEKAVADEMTPVMNALAEKFSEFEQIHAGNFIEDQAGL